MTVTRTRRPLPEPDDRRQNQTTVARTRQPLPEPDDRRRRQTTVARTRRPLLEPDDDSSDNQPPNTTNDSINRSVELNQSLNIGPLPTESNQGLLGRHPDNHHPNLQPANGYRERFESIRAFNRADPSPELNQTLTQTGRQAGRRGPLPEPDDRRSNNQPANTTNDSIDRSIELNKSFDIVTIESRPPREAPQTTTVRMYSQRTAIENDSNQLEPLIGPTPSPN